MEDIFPSSFEKISLVVISVKFLPQKIIYYHVIGRRAEQSRAGLPQATQLHSVWEWTG